MATDSLQIFGTSYTGVTGIKATDSSNGTKTYIRPQGTKSITANGTGIDVTEYASVDVNITAASPNLLSKTNIVPITSSQIITADNGYDGLSSVQVNGDANLVAGNIKSGTTIFGVTGTYTGSGGSSKNIQYVMGRYEVSATSYTATDLSITISKAGSYKCYWVMDRNTTSGTTGSRLYKNGSEVGSAHTSWTYNGNNRNGMNCEETLTLAADDVLVVRARSRSTSYICGVSNLIIIEQ